VEEKRDQAQLTRDEISNAYERMIEQYMTTIEALMRALDERDIISSGHSSRVADLSHEVGIRMELNELELRELRLAALLHDVGKIGISENILGKPGRLTDQEYFLIKKHPEIGEKLVGKIEFLQPLAASIRHTHERFDGKGYPDGIAGNTIDLKARIIAVADTYDFLRSDLSFRRAMSVDDSLREIKKSAGTQFDPNLVRIFVDTVNETKSSYQH